MVRLVNEHNARMLLGHSVLFLVVDLPDENDKRLQRLRKSCGFHGHRGEENHALPTELTAQGEHKGAEVSAKDGGSAAL